MLPDLEPPFISPSMCRTRRDTLVSKPKPKHQHKQTTPRPSSNAPPSSPPPPALRYSTTNSDTFPADLSSRLVSTSSSSSSSSVAASLSGLRLSLIDGSPTLYPFHEIAAATNNFLSKRLASSSWRCTLRSREAVILQLAFRSDPVSLPSRLSSLCKCNHSSLVKLLGASLTADYFYLVYDYTPGATLKECLRNPRNPNFTPLSKWISRMQVAADLAQGLEYIHFHCRTIHNRIKSSSVIITEPTFNAKISLFGVADLAGEVPEEDKKKIKEEDDEEEAEEEEEEEGINLKRSDSRKMRIDGTRGYIAPEVIAGGRISQKSDVFAFGVVMLELLSGREPLEYTINEKKGEYGKVSLIETARDAIGTEDDDGASEEEAEERRGRVRRWVDRRLRDSFPVDAAEKLVRLALRCVEAEAFMRPQMTEVAGRVSKLFLDSRVWEENIQLPADFSVTIGPR